MVERRRAGRILIRHVHNPQTPEQKLNDFNEAVKRVRNSNLTPPEQAARIERLRSAHLGTDLAIQGDVFTTSHLK